MANVTSASQGTMLRPEDATTLEEFQARRDAELSGDVPRVHEGQCSRRWWCLSG
jgi:hypothetical protein